MTPKRLPEQASAAAGAASDTLCSNTAMVSSGLSAQERRLPPDPPVVKPAALLQQVPARVPLVAVTEGGYSEDDAVRAKQRV